MKAGRLSPVVAALFAVAAVRTIAAPRNVRGRQDGDVQKIKQAEDDADEAMGLALREHDELLAAAAFGAFLRRTDKVSDADAIGKIVRFSKRKGMFFKAAQLVSVYAEWPEVAAVAAGDKDSDATRFAAALYATGALGDILQREVEARLGGSPAGGRHGGGGGGKKGRREPAVAQPGDVKIPVALLESRDADTRRLAILAAAYAADATVKEAVAAAASRPGAGEAEALLYAARIGATPSADQVAAVLKKAGRVPKPVSMPTAELASHTFDVPAACFVAEALGWMRDAARLPVLKELLGSPDMRVEHEAARAIRRIDSDAAVPTLEAALRECRWPALVEICATLAAHPAKTSIVPLVNRLAKEKGRFRLDLVYALSAIAGEQKGQTAEEWKNWWLADGQAFEVDPAAGKAYREKTRVQDVKVPGNGFFYGLTIFSDRFSYVVDSSQSMKGDRIASLRDNMTSSLQMLKDWVMYNLVDYGGEVHVMYEKALTDNKRLGVNRIEDMELTWATRSFDALELASQLAGLDTVYFLSDGAPIRGQLDSWSTIMRALRLQYRYLPVAIFTIDFDPSPANRRAMQQLADENYGLHEPVEMGGGQGR